MAWSERLLALVYPPRCVVRGCGGRGAWLCPACRLAIRPVPEPTCLRCGAPLKVGACPDCAAVRPRFDGLVCAGLFAPPLRDAIHALKYRGVRPLAPILASLMARQLTACEPASQVVPVPSHPRRVAARGLDPTHLLGQSLAMIAGLPWAPELLARSRATAPQVGLDYTARRHNVAGAFRAAGLLPPVRVLLVDDVLTTGATASACAEALLAAGAERVTVCVVARAAGEGLLGRHVSGHL